MPGSARSRSRARRAAAPCSLARSGQHDFGRARRRLLRTAARRAAIRDSTGERTGTRMFAPEVVQTSAMDCGPAALACLLEGFGIPASYAPMQEACQTDLDGTSINTLEQIAGSLGLDVEQIMLPIDHVLRRRRQRAAGAGCRAARRPPHFLVAWRRHGPLVQIMDPAKGRRWLRTDCARRRALRPSSEGAGAGVARVGGVTGVSRQPGRAPSQAADRRTTARRSPGRGGDRR